MPRLIIDTPRWLFLLCLIYAPWAYGCTTSGTTAGLVMLLGLTFMVWMGETVLRRTWPRVHWLGSVCIAALLVQGWWMAVNPHFRFDPASHVLLPVVSISRKLAGSVDRHSSVATMIRLSMMLLVVCFAARLARHPVWAKRICWTIGLTGASIISFGLIQRALQAPMIFWGESRPGGSVFFSTYYYSGNAGAYINLVMPMLLGMVILSMRERRNQVSRAFWVSMLFLGIAAALVNLSRAAQIVTLFEMLLMAIWFSKHARPLFGMHSTARRVCYAVLLGAASLILIKVIGWREVAQKWAFLMNQLNAENPRYVAVSVCLKMLPDAGALGFGPGTYQLVFPHYASGFDRAIWANWGIWFSAHQDYLQTVVEWGWFGAALWSVLFFGGIVRLGRSLFRSGHGNYLEEGILRRAGAIALIGIAVHGLVDFPLQIISLQLYVATFLGVAWSVESVRPDSLRNARS
jgi:hypothetical protein